MENKRVFLDINIVLDILNAERPHHHDAKELWETLVLGGYEIVISEDMLSTIYYIEKDKPGVLRFFAMIQERWKIVPFGHEVISQAIMASSRRQADLEDLLQCFCAKAHRCDVLITNDQSFVPCGIDVMGYETFAAKRFSGA